jgi:hypothetical protein
MSIARARKLRKAMTPQEVKLWFISAAGDTEDSTFAANVRAMGTFSISSACARK